MKQCKQSKKSKQSKIIGLTGNSGSGKTTVAEILKEHAFIISSDKIARDVLVKDTPCYLEVLNRFGNEILNDDLTINRKKLGKIIFEDKEKHLLLTEITHKYIDEITLTEINSHKNDNEFIVIDIPILIGNKIQEVVDEIWVVYAPREVHIERIMNRDNISREYAINRLDKQIPFDELKNYADVLIANHDKSKEELKKEVLENLFNRNN